MRLLKFVSVTTTLFALTACGQASLGIASATAAPTRPSSPATQTPSAGLTPTLAPIELTFETATYRDATLGFELDYPVEWEPPTLVEKQPRGDIVQAKMDGQVMLDIVTLRWDPKNDLPAYIQVREQAFKDSGFTILEKEQVSLGEDWNGVGYKMETATGEQAYFFFASIGAQYLQLSGSGDLDRLTEIASTIRLTN
ncbi:MAG: hypothetical protein PVI81_00225 [Anaerolineales bacterium]|jgi:hypothetical protein